MRISDWSSDVCSSDLHAMVQIPVVPMLCGGSPWVRGHYGDEFAEAHGKELVVRSRLATPMPSAGVGCALTRNALALLALHRGGRPLDRKSTRLNSSH